MPQHQVVFTTLVCKQLQRELDKEISNPDDAVEFIAVSANNPERLLTKAKDVVRTLAVRTGELKLILKDIIHYHELIDKYKEGKITKDQFVEQITN